MAGDNALTTSELVSSMSGGPPRERRRRIVGPLGTAVPEKEVCATLADTCVTKHPTAIVEPVETPQLRGFFVVAEEGLEPPTRGL